MLFNIMFKVNICKASRVHEFLLILISYDYILILPIILFSAFLFHNRINFNKALVYSMGLSLLSIVFGFFTFKIDYS